MGGRAAFLGTQPIWEHSVCACVSPSSESEKMGSGGRRQTVLIITDPPDPKKGKSDFFLSFAPPYSGNRVCGTYPHLQQPRNVKEGNG